MSKHVSPSMFLSLVLTQPMTPDSQLMVTTLWIAWFNQILKEMACHGIELSFDPDDPAEITAKFRVQGMPNLDSMVELPVDDSPYKLHIMSKIRTGCSLKED